MAATEFIRTLIDQFLVSIITLVFGFLLAVLAGRIVRHVLREVEINRVLKAAGIRIDKTIAHIAEYSIYTITVLVVLQQLGLTRIVLGVLFVAAAIVLSISLLLTIRDFIPNFFSGWQMRKELRKHVGKKVEIGMVKGTLKRTGVIASVVYEQEEHYVPNVYARRNGVKLLRAKKQH